MLVSTLVFILAPFLVSSTPVNRPTSGGAAYFMTNLDDNVVVSNKISPDGKLAIACTTKTRGRGSAGVVANPGADPLFTQDSAGSNTVVMFRIDPNDPTRLTMVGNPVSSGGDFPVSIAVSEAKNMVCVLNGGEVNGVNCFKPDPQVGLLPIQGTRRSLNISQSTPPTGPAGTVSDILFSADSSKLLATVKGTPPNPGFLAAWSISNDGSLSKDFVSSTPATGGLLPFSATPIKDKNALLVTDPGAGFSVYDLSGLSVEQNKPASSSIIPVQGQKAVCWSAFSPKTGNYYLTDIGTSTVTEASVDGNLKGAVVKQYPLAANSSTIDVAIASLSSNDFLYVLSASAKSIDVLALNAPANARPIQTLKFESALKSKGITVDGNRVQGMAVFVRGS
ncbi:SubName: Full=Uncharacterized protein {ECO:0000313/EMBL:CCA66684.1} [Serendipita indica DSM 11827]|nr:SubName: Full=Uncharacterized protein {ECO:0000313/EMBL:CCA66684.1} [Serendipita indica DSM 11827]